jgi:tetratricopeptide (TPR) repeat protein
MEQSIKPGINKRLLIPGDQTIKIMSKSKCTIDYTLYRINQNNPIKIDSSIDRKLGLVFTIGDGEVISALEYCVSSMYQREKSQFRINGEYFDHGIIEGIDSEYRLDVEVKWVVNEKILPHQRIEQALVLKEQGARFFAQKEFLDAVKSYSSAISGMDDWGATLAQIDEMNKLRVVLHSNIAACLLKENKFVDAAISSSDALKIDPGCLKAAFRLAQARVGLHEYDAAVEGLRDFVKMCEVCSSLC